MDKAGRRALIKALNTISTARTLLNGATLRAGKCPESGCVKEVDGKWRVISNKTGKLWPQHYETKEDAEGALAGYHMHS